MEEFHFELWEEIYTEKDIEDAFEKCKVLHFKEIYNYELDITPISSGHHLGSSNWVVKFPHSNAKLGYISKSSVF